MPFAAAAHSACEARVGQDTAALREQEAAQRAATSATDNFAAKLEGEAAAIGRTTAKPRAMEVAQGAAAAEGANLPDQAARIRAAGADGLDEGGGGKHQRPERGNEQERCGRIGELGGEQRYRVSVERRPVGDESQPASELRSAGEMYSTLPWGIAEPAAVPDAWFNNSAILLAPPGVSFSLST